MLLAHQKSIRDVIPFPKNSKNQDLLMDAPKWCNYGTTWWIRLSA
nr:hypothetical protein [Mycoplasmopsis bovis]